jgi:hypothetical protein
VVIEQISQARHYVCLHLKKFFVAGIKYEGKLISSNEVNVLVLCVLMIWKMVFDLHCLIACLAAGYFWSS